MSAFSAAASDEDCDEINRLREQRDELLEALRAQRDDLLEALRITVQSLAWFHDGLERPNDALSIARMAIEKAALRKAAEQALEALEAITGVTEMADVVRINRAITALHLALEVEQDEQDEPVAWIEHEWSGSGLRHLHFDRREPSVRDEVMRPVWMPLYTRQQPAHNLNCKSTQKRLATQWGFVPAQQPLTEFQIHECWHPSKYQFTRNIEAAHGITGETK